MREYEINPSEFGLKLRPTSTFQVANAAESKAIILGVLDPTASADFYAAREIVCLNAGLHFMRQTVCPISLVVLSWRKK